MSQSPTDVDAPALERERYSRAWLALNELVDQGRSWSGNERNCCFLNTGQKRFADISAASGIDFADDGRGVALTDWDFDGRVDMWVTNRTAPRVRLLHNETRVEDRHHFMALRLEGTRCNRDAIGARVEIKLQARAELERSKEEINPDAEIVVPDGEHSVPNVAPRATHTTLVKTLHAGDGFVAQSSKWLHFGLGPQQQIVELVVHWPDRSRESFGRPAVDSFYRLVQGTGRATVWNPPRQSVNAVAQPIRLPAPSKSKRTWILGRIPFSPVGYRSWDGNNHSLDQYRGQPLLVNLWSASCHACLQELSEWAADWEMLEVAGLRILALTVDGLADSSDEDTSIAQTLTERLALPFSTGMASTNLTLAMEMFHRSYVARERQLPVPCSVLIDREGRLAAIYKGKVSAEQLLEDVELLDVTPDQQRAAAVPFSGSWSGETFESNPRGLLAKYTFAGQRDQVIAYINHYLQHIHAELSPELEADIIQLRGDALWDKGDHRAAAADFARFRALKPRDANAHRHIGQRLLSEGLVPQALAHLDLVVEQLPNDANLLMNLAIREAQLGRFDRSVVRFRQVLRLKPREAAVHFQFASVLLGAGDPEQAVHHYREAYRLQPNQQIANNLAWILATHESEEIRDGKQAVEFAEAACREDGFQTTALLDTLAAAYAEAGLFEDAVRWIDKAIENATSVDLVEQLQQRRSLYESKRPYRQK